MAYSDIVLADDPIGYWPLDETAGSTTVVDVKGAKNGAVQAGTTLGAVGRYGSSMSTSGSGKGVVVGAGNVLGSGWTALTVEAWIKTTSADGAMPVVFNDNESGTFSQRNWALRINSGTPVFSVFTGSSLGSATSSVTVNDGQWHHLVGTYDGANVRIYVDGVERGSAARTGNPNASTSSSLRFGLRQSDTYSFPGQIDEIAIYSTALSAARVAAHYYVTSGYMLRARTLTTRTYLQTTMSRTRSLLVVGDPYGRAVAADSPTDWWRLSETSGTVLANTAAPSRPGTVVGSPALGVAGISGTAVKFLGTATDYVALPSGPWAAGGQSAFSMECWFRLASDRSREHFLFGGAASGGAVTEFRVRTDGMLRVFVATGTGTSGIGLTSTISVDDDKWHHAVLAYSRAVDDIFTMQLFIDGTQNISASASGTPLFATTGWGIGYLATGPCVSLATVDEVAVYQGVALSAARVAAHYISVSRTVSSLRTRTLAAAPVVVPPGTASMVRTRSLALTHSEVAATANMVRSRTLRTLRTGETLGLPIGVSVAGDVSVPTSGWFVDADEETLGAVGSGAFWFRVTTSRRILVSVTSTVPLHMRAYKVVDPLLPTTISNLTLVSEGEEVEVVATSHFYVMVDVPSPAGTATFTFTYEEALTGAASLFVVSESGGSVTTASVALTPAILSATATATSDVTSLDLIFDGVAVASNLPLAADNTWSGVVPIPSRPAGTYDLFVHGDGADVDSEVIQVIVERTAIPVAPVDDDAPARVPASSTGRWVLSDPATGNYYEFPMNPATASSWNSPRNHSVESTTKPTAFVVYEGSLNAKSYTFGGVLLDEAMYQSLAAFSRLNRRVWLVDHNLVAWQVVPQKFDVRPRTNRLNPWVQDYEFTVLLLKGPTQAEVD